MTLGRLVVAWLCVGGWFLVAGWAGRKLAGAAGRVAPAATLAEAGVVTLFGSLWFDTLGAGGWWLVFLLVGLLAAFPVRLQQLLAWNLSLPIVRRPELHLALTDVVRYVVAGAILAWRLG